MDIGLLDNLIIGSPSVDPFGLGYYSFNEAGLLQSATYDQECVYEPCPKAVIK